MTKKLDTVDHVCALTTVSTIGEGDVVGCLLDLDNNTIAFSVNGAMQGTAFEAVNTRNAPLHPAVCVKEGSVELRCGDGEAVRHLPEGYQAVGGLSEEHVTHGAQYC